MGPGIWKGLLAFEKTSSHYMQHIFVSMAFLSLKQNIVGTQQSLELVDRLTAFVYLLQESYPSTSPIWFVDSDDPSLAEVLERLEDVRKGSTLVSSHTIQFSILFINIYF